MAGDRPPEAWIGRQVEATIINAAAYDEYGLPSPPASRYCIGILEAVSKFGAIASLWYDREDEEEEPPVGTFYPWSLVVWLRSEEA